MDRKRRTTRFLRYPPRSGVRSAAAKRFLKLKLFKQEISHQAAKAGILKLQVSDLALFALNWLISPLGVNCEAGGWTNQRSMGLAPAVICHDANAQ